MTVIRRVGFAFDLLPNCCAGVTNAVGQTRRSSIRKLREARVLAADAEREFVSKRGSKPPAQKKHPKPTAEEGPSVGATDFAGTHYPIPGEGA